MSEDKKNAAPAQGTTASEKSGGKPRYHKHYNDKRKHHNGNRPPKAQSHGESEERKENSKPAATSVSKAEGGSAKAAKAANNANNANGSHGSATSKDKRGHKPQGDKSNRQSHHKSRSNRGKPHPKPERNEAVTEAAEAEAPLFSELLPLEDLNNEEPNYVFDYEEEVLDGEEPATEAESAPKEPRKEVEIVGIRFKAASKIYYFSPEGISFAQNEGAIVETARGQEYGFVAIENRMVDETEIFQPLKSVLRKATPEDTEKHAKNKQQEARAAEVWAELVKKHKLVMNLTDVEYTFDNAKLIFYFTADGRIDFRELVKDLAAVFRTRIELRQIGVRDEAKLVGGLGICGMPFCCNRFLSDFAQVSIKMAKEQNLSLSSSKISGNCGRLMCCLRYEQEVYEREYATFPKVDSIVQTPAGNGVITESNFLNGRIKVRMDGDGAATYKYFTRKEVKVVGRAKSSRDEIDKELKKLED